MTEVVRVTDPTICAVQRWRVGRDSQVTPASVLCLVTRSDGSTGRVMAPVSGRVIRLAKEDGDLLNLGDTLVELQTSCDHEVVMKDMCALCGANLREQLGWPGQRVLPTTASIPMVHSIPELYVSEKRAHKLAQIDQERLIRDRRLILLVDLDQTLIHTTMDSVPPNLQGVTRFRLPGDRHPAGYTTRMRPGGENFLAALNDKFELHIVTFGNRLYAHRIAEIIDPEKKFFSHRILSRDEAFNPATKTGNLKALFPRGDDLVCIIDDRDEVWECAPNLIHVKKYSYFVGTDDINNPHKGRKTSAIDPMDEAAEQAEKRLESEEQEERRQLEQKVEKTTSADDSATPCEEQSAPVKEDKPDENSNSKSTDANNSSASLEWPDHDNYLPRLQEILFSIHEEFYSTDVLPDASNLPSMRDVLPRVRRRVLHNCAIVFSGVFPQQMPMEKSKAYHIATGLGAIVQNSLRVPESSGKKRSKHGDSKKKRSKKRRKYEEKEKEKEGVDVEEKESEELKEDEVVMSTHLVAARSNTSKWHTARRAGIHVVTPDWLWACHYEWKRLPEEDFELRPAPDGESPATEPAESRQRRLLEERQYARLSRQSKRPLPDAVEEEHPEEDDEALVAEQVAAALPSPPIFGLADHPLMRISRTDLEDMEEEVQAAANEDSTDSSSSSSSSSQDSESKRDRVLRAAVLGTSSGGSSPVSRSLSGGSGEDVEESQEAQSPWSGEYPEGWEPRRRHKVQGVPSEEDRDWGEGYAQEGYDYADAERNFKALSDSASSISDSESGGGAELSEEGEDTLDALREFM